MTQRKIFRPWDSDADHGIKGSSPAVPHHQTITPSAAAPTVLSPVASPSSLFSLNLWTSFFLPGSGDQSLVHSPASPASSSSSPSFYLPSMTRSSHHVHHHHHHPSAFSHISSLVPPSSGRQPQQPLFHSPPSSHGSNAGPQVPSLMSVRQTRSHHLTEVPDIRGSETSLRSGSTRTAIGSSMHCSERSERKAKRQRPKRFHCPHCHIAFSNQGQLRGHVRTHTGERPFVCDHSSCGKSFTRNEELTRHKRIHTGLRPFACVVCGKRFGRKDHLKKHQRTHDRRSLAFPTVVSSSFQSHAGSFFAAAHVAAAAAATACKE